MGAIARGVLRHRRSIGLLWLVIGIIGVAGIGHVTSRLTSSADFPGLSSFEAGQSIMRTYGNGGNNLPIGVVVTLPGDEHADSASGRRDLTLTYAALAKDSAIRVLTYPTVNDARLISTSGHSVLGLVLTTSSPPTSAHLESMLRAHAPPGVTVETTSINDLYNAAGGQGVGILGEVIIGGIGALVVLALVFGSFLSLIPLAIAAGSILATFLLLGLVTLFADVSQLVEYLVALIGLGIAIDYSLLIVTRWREERRAGSSNDDAIVTALLTAGRSVVFSGLTVGIGLFALVVLPIPFLRSLGYGGLLIPLVTVVAALTLLPVLLSSFGPRLDRRGAKRAHHRSSQDAHRAWTAWTRAVIRHRLIATVAGVFILGILLSAALTMRVGEIQPTSLAHAGSAEQGLRDVERNGYPLGVLQPIEILVPGSTNPTALVAKLQRIPGVFSAVAPSNPAWRKSGTALVDVMPSAPTSESTNVASIERIEQVVHRAAPHAQIAGDGVEEIQVVHDYYDRFPLLIALVALVSLLTLARAFRSVILPVKAIVLNLLSMGAAYGALVLMWQDGYVSRAVWGIPATGVIVDFVPLILFAFLFGLSMDYEVFILTRIKEAHDAGMTTDEAIIEGMGKTGRLVTSAAIILFLAFAALGAGPIVPLKVFATGMGVGILIDAVIIRGLLVPAVVSLLGRRNWWAPAWMDRSPSPGTVTTAAADLVSAEA
jgi:RND superfamily putative drug exporter